MSAGRLELGYSFPMGTNLVIPAVRDPYCIWMEMIGRAREFCGIEQLYVACLPGSKIEAVLCALEEAAQRGVMVRMLVDETMFLRNKRSAVNEYVDPIMALMGKSDVDIGFVPIGRTTGGVQHAKFMVVDGEEAWLGSQNFDWRSLDHIVELGVFLRQKDLVEDLREVFEFDWALSKAQSATPSGAARVQGGQWREVVYREQSHEARIVASPAGLTSEGMYDLPFFLEVIGAAERTISFQTRKYTTIPRGGEKEWALLSIALREAALRGVHVRIMVDRNSGRGAEHEGALTRLARVDNVEVRRALIPEAETGVIPYARMLHAKTLTVDTEVSWVGTGNCAPDDFLRSRNVGVAVRGRAFSEDVEAVFERCWRSEYSKAF